MTMRDATGAQDTQNPLYWLGPELARSGLVRNEDWIVPHVERAQALFVNRGVHTAAALLAALHVRAIDYIEQAPILALAATYGLRTSRKTDRTYIAMNFGPLVEKGRRLRDVLTVYRVAYPLRAVSGHAMRPGVWDVLQAISKHVDPSTIAQAIPADPTKHMFWLGDLADLWVHIDRRFLRTGGDAAEEYRAAVLRWAMLALSRAGSGKRFQKTIWATNPARAEGATSAEIGDFLIAERARFNPRWTWERMVQETRDWHEAISNAQIDDLNDGRYDVEVDYAPFPVEQEVDGFTFHALRSLRALIVEGRAMHHCVSTYYRDVVSGQCRIYSIRKDGRRVATAEFVGFPAARAVQVKGVCNALPPKAVRVAADKFAEAARKAAR